MTATGNSHYTFGHLFVVAVLLVPACAAAQPQPTTPFRLTLSSREGKSEFLPLLPVAITLRPGVPGSPNYPLLPFDVTIEIRNLTSESWQCAASFFSSTVARRMDLATYNRWRIWSPGGAERRIMDVCNAPWPLVGGPEQRPWPEVQPGAVDHVRQVLRLVRYQNVWSKGPERLPLVEEVFLFPKPGTYVTQLKARLGVSSNLLTIEVSEPVGRDREAYEYLLQCRYPFVVAGVHSYPLDQERDEAAAFVAQYGDTIYAPYARFYLSLYDYREAKNDLATSGVVTNESFLELWDELNADENFRLWPWVLKNKADYLSLLARRRYAGRDPVTRRHMFKPVVRLGETLTRVQQKEIGLEARVLREFLKNEYPYFPD